MGAGIQTLVQQQMLQTAGPSFKCHGLLFLSGFYLYLRGHATAYGGQRAAPSNQFSVYHVGTRRANVSASGVPASAFPLSCSASWDLVCMSFVICMNLAGCAEHGPDLSSPVRTDPSLPGPSQLVATLPLSSPKGPVCVQTRGHLTVLCTFGTKNLS